MEGINIEVQKQKAWGRRGKIHRKKKKSQDDSDVYLRWIYL